MNTIGLLKECLTQGVTIYLSGREVKLRGSPDAIRRMTPMLKARKTEIQEFLSSAPSHGRPDASDERGKLLSKLTPFFIEKAEDGMFTTLHSERINNMAWEFMESDGMAFQEAIRLAAEITSMCPIALCEASYAGVSTLWNRLNNSAKSK